jgi:4a-hydroxytetrahydrobiopterin dehydratase
MSELNKERCEACRAGAPRVSDEELAALMKQLPEWVPRGREDFLTLQREFKFRNFSESMAFSVRVGMLAESEGHHPEIVTEWGRVRVTWWTHKIRGLHRNDFICAAKTDRIYAPPG